MKRENILFLISILLFNLAYQQELDSLIKENSKLSKSIKKLDEKLKKLKSAESQKANDKLNLIKELTSITNDLNEEKEKFELFGHFSEESGLKYLRDFRETISKSDPSQLYTQLDDYEENFNILEENVQNRLNNINRLIANIVFIMFIIGYAR